MNDDLVALIFVVLFGTATFALGMVLQRNRSNSAEQEIWQDGFTRGHESATKRVFRTAIRAVEDRTHNAAPALRFRNRVGGRAQVPQHAAEETDTTVEAGPSQLGEDTTVVLFRARSDKAA